ncbi:hypothetical protein PybrP1_007492 [[Pythium] brassicae (nom. inval.)]|nr:hypothetical protein PybrP1_007492 [[Pythium] brassicae (nom. inval.)]
MAASSFRALFQSLFTEEEDDAQSRNPHPNASPPRRRLGSNALQPAAVARLLGGRRQRRQSASSACSSVSSTANSELPYEPRAADGEYIASFPVRPLGMGLVPSTQLYGSWEVSSVSAAVASGERVRYDDNAGGGNRTRQALLRVARGDVIVALNGSRVKAQLPRQQLAAYLQECALPVVVTLRRPALYAAVDSRSLATAMYPLSIDYEAAQPFAEQKRFAGRATSAQWQRTLHHELAQNARQAKSDRAKRLAHTLVSGGVPDNQSPRSCSSGVAEPLGQSPAALSPRRSPVVSPRQLRARAAMAGGGQQLPPSSASPQSALSPTAVVRDKPVELSPMGEFELVFSEHPLHLVLAPSTRMYASVEIYNPKTHGPGLQVGDVVMAVNGDASVARWTTEDLIDFLAGLLPPVVVRFRRPTAYRQYLEKYFKTSKAISSRSVVHAMFPRSAEYKSTPPKSSSERKRLAAATTTNNSNSPPLEPARSNTANNRPQATAAADSPHGRHEHALMSPSPELLRPHISEMRDFSFKIDATEQFKLWNGGGRDGAAQSSSVLTERHVRFLWSHLPPTLSCNEMELVYSTRYHGWNLLSFYARLQGKGPTILVVQDTRDNIFGAFCATSWQDAQEVYGNGRAFVFTLRPQMHVYPWAGHEGSFMYSRRDAVFVGGGARGIALCLQLDDMRGFSRGCETFESPPLTDRGGDFECEICEVWSFSGLRI